MELEDKERDILIELGLASEQSQRSLIGLVQRRDRSLRYFRIVSSESRLGVS